MRRGLSDVDPGATVIVACSGGADSLALLAATVFEGAKAGWHVVGATVDHGLQEGSGAHAERVVAQMAALGADETVGARVTVEGGGLGPEAAARQARYAVLGEMAQRFEAAAVLLGHTRDDQAETVLLGLARGSGGRSLAGMRRTFEHYRRPLLDLGRVDTVTACQVEGLDFWDDPHNVDPAFARSRVRARVLPMLETELGPGVAESLARTADQLRADMDLLDDIADTVFADLGDELPVADPGRPPAPDPQACAAPRGARGRLSSLRAVPRARGGDGRADHRLARPAVGRPPGPPAVPPPGQLPGLRVGKVRDSPKPCAES